jgi:hypothetical protein
LNTMEQGSLWLLWIILQDLVYNCTSGKETKQTTSANLLHVIDSCNSPSNLNRFLGFDEKAFHTALPARHKNDSI